MDTVEKLVEDVESLQHALMSIATGGAMKADDYACSADPLLRIPK